MATPQPALPLSTNGQPNMAPLKPLIDLKDGAKKPSTYIQKALKELWDHFYGQDKGVWRELINCGQQLELFIQGHQRLLRNPINGSYTIVPITNQQSPSINIMQNLERNLQMKWGGSNPDILIRPGRNLDKCVTGAKGGQVIWDHYTREFYHAWYNQQECRSALTFGTYANRIFYDDSLKSVKILQDLFEAKDAKFGEGAGQCEECRFSGPAQAFTPPMDVASNGGMQAGFNDTGFPSGMARPRCPQCQSDVVTVEPAAQGSLSSVSSQQEIWKGDLVCQPLLFPGLRYDLRRRLEESSFCLYSQEVTMGTVMQVLGNVQIPGTPEFNEGLDVIRGLGYSGQARGGTGAYGYRSQGKDNDGYAKDRLSFDEMWLLPEHYAHINLIGDEKTLGGTTIPKGKLTDVFPDGLCVVGLNGMALILGIYAEKHTDHMTSGVWFIKGMSGAGRGLNDSLEVQREFSSFKNQASIYWKTVGTPSVIVNELIMPSGKAKYLGSPNTNIPLNMTKLPEGAKLSDSIYQWQPGSIPAGFTQHWQQFLNVMAQKTSNVTDYNQGEPGITGSNDTATAAEIDQSNADSINQPTFQLKAEARKRNAEITLKLYPKYFPMERPFHLAGKYGKQQIVELYGSDLDTDLKYEVVPNSEMPKGPFTQRKNLQTLFTITQGGMGYAQLKAGDPKLAAALVDTFDVDLDKDDVDDVTEICRRRLDQMTQATKVGVSDPEALLSAIEPPIDPAEPNLPLKAKWFSDALDWDELLEAPMALRAACSLLARNQFQSGVAQQAQMAVGQGVVETAGQLPQALGQQAMQQGQEQPPEQPQVDPNAEAKIAADQQAQQASAAESEAQRQHEAEQATATRAHELKMKTADAKLKDKEHANKVKLAAMKPKPKATAKK